MFFKYQLTTSFLITLQVMFACALVSVARAGLLAAPHGALSTQSIVLGAPALAHGYGGYAAAAPAYGYGLGNELELEIFRLPIS